MNRSTPRAADTDSPIIDRRTLLLGAGALGLVACTSTGEDAVGDGDTTRSVTSDTTGATSPATTGAIPDAAVTTSQEQPVGVTTAALSGADFDGLAICALLPSTPAGPFPSPEQLDRRDLTEGYPGHPLRLGLRVVDQECAPIAGAQVEIWHTDASGDYSAYVDEGDGKDEGSGTTFMRGFQTSDGDGITEFSTVFPGWYSGRVAHVHVRVRVGDTLALTTQLYFDDAYTDEIFSTPPYAEFGPQDTTWATDGLIGDPATDGSAITLRPADTERGPGTLGIANIGLSS